MGGFEVGEVFVVEYFVEYAVGVPGCAAADEFAVGCSECVEDGVVEFLVVCDEVKFVSVYYVEGWSADGFGVVWEGFDDAAVGEADLGFLGLKSDALWEHAAVGGYTRDDAFALPPRRRNYADCDARVFHRVLQKQRRYGLGFAALPAPAGSRKLVILEGLGEFFLVAIRLKAEGFLEEFGGVIA